MQPAIPQIPESLLTRRPTTIAEDFYDLAAACGLVIRPDVIRIILRMIQLNVPPTVIMDTLREMARQSHE
ncbi:hypothetical protein SeMB42_g06038 [Synchytrium endobioticum]|uniref:Mitotic-spindle organizing protein 1 n=1 Tax=Synchytrium endobioticum TaxID=286115 RepID=A0A507CYQ1_9FUNG|nr:hypothetical protein SeMB42_g06038 [Synchytrium endobioticum]TPX44191.1 hypothetical protein SeLEV6574_g04639 [Synchytrium endobioticum]